MFVDRVIDAAANGRTFDADEFYQASRDFENAWIEPSVTINYLEPLDGIEVSRKMYDKYAPLILAHPASAAPTAVASHHHW